MLTCTFLAAVLSLPGAVDGLGADSWPVREAASARLRSAGPLAVPLLEGALLSDDLETRQRARRLLAAERERVLLSCLPRGWTRLPWIDGIAISTPGQQMTREQCECLALANECGINCQPAEWPSYRYACRLWCQRRLARGDSPASIRADVQRLAAGELAWRLRQGQAVRAIDGPGE